MRFVLVQCASADEWGWPQWRATHVKADGFAIDVFFYKPNVDQARAHVRSKYANATFSDQETPDAV